VVTPNRKNIAGGTSLPLVVTMPELSLAVDATSNNASKSFQVTVIGATGQTTSLGDLARSFSLETGIARSLLAKLADVLADIDVGNVQAACGVLVALSTRRKRRPEKKITSAHAAQLIAAVNQIRTVLVARENGPLDALEDAALG